jgi:hypothetical protein
MTFFWCFLAALAVPLAMTGTKMIAVFLEGGKNWPRVPIGILFNTLAIYVFVDAFRGLGLSACGVPN